MDQIYIDRVLAGDLSAFQYFLGAYKDMAYSVAISIVKQEHLAEEVVQDAFMNCYQSLSNFKGKSKFSTWFYRIVVNCSYRTLRREGVKVQELNMELHDGQFEDSIFQQLEKKEKEWFVQEALLQLGANEALVLRLFYLEELSVQEVKEITGWIETNIKNHITPWP